MFEMNINLSDGDCCLRVPLRVNCKNFLASLWQLKGLLRFNSWHVVLPGTVYDKCVLTSATHSCSVRRLRHDSEGKGGERL